MQHPKPVVVANRLLPWEQNHGVSIRGRTAMTYPDSIWAETGLNDVGEIGACWSATDTVYRHSDAEASKQVIN